MSRAAELTGGPDAPGPDFSLEATAERLGSFVWTERRLFEVLGASVAFVEKAAVKIMVDRHAAHAAWRGDQWWERLPVLSVIDRTSLVLPPSPGAADVFDEVEARQGIGRLAGLYRVALPRLAVAYRAEWAFSGPVAHGPIRRTLGQAETDLEADRSEGEATVQSLLTSTQAVDEAAATVAALERLLTTAERLLTTAERLLTTAERLLTTAERRLTTGERRDP